VAGGALNAEEFAGFARARLADLDAILVGHHATHGVCSCGRPVPCPQADSLTRQRQHLCTRMALAETTVALPVVADTGGAQTRRRRRWWHRGRWGWNWWPRSARGSRR
jgi:hypothetical protein